MPKPIKIALLESYRGGARSVMARLQPDHMTLLAAERYGDHIHAGELCGEVFAASAMGYANVATWFAGLFDHPSCVRIEDGPELQRTRSLAECDAVLLCANETSALKALIEKVQRRTPAAAIFTVSGMLTPSERAMVLNWGAEDVLDIGMPAREGAARIRAVCRRIAQTRAARRVH
ncbi:hypothetical protein [Novosphingobium sp.]|uniref:hypothetical protein n=1 Tax=Novosphingobium sp. TaxID=1874826 RepID=UPI0026240328|nr:hypothetical protein [Novosphingobium sp.]